MNCPRGEGWLLTRIYRSSKVEVRLGVFFFFFFKLIMVKWKARRTCHQNKATLPLAECTT